MNPFLDLQTRAVSRLQEQAWFADVPFVTEDAGDINSAVATALAQGALSQNASGKAGLAILILTPAGAIAAEGSAPVVQVQLTVSIFENVTINRDASAGIRKTALTALNNVIYQLAIWRPFRAQAMHFTGFESEQDNGQPGVIAYHAHFSFPREITQFVAETLP